MPDLHDPPPGDPLGPRAGLPRDLARQAWGPVLGRSDVRHAFIWMALGAFLLVAGAIGLSATGEALVAFVSGLLGLGAGFSALRAHAGDWRAWRAIGDVVPELERQSLVAGSESVVRLRIRPRRDLVVADATATLIPASTGAERLPEGTAPFDFALVPAGTSLRAGEPAVFEVVVALPDDVMASRYDHSGSRRWSLHVSLRTADGAAWARELPVFVVAGRAGSPVHVS